ncbi:MAG: class I SAM-dependent methyltransferase [Bacteroidota bacterium]
MNLFFEYIKYRWNAKGRHGIHSPFVYEILDKGFKKKPSKDFLIARKQLFTLYNSNQSVIEVEDFGAGSKYFDRKRKVNAIFKRSASRGKKSKLLYHLMAHFEPNNVLEMGTSLGIGTFSMAFDASNSKIVTVEACKNTQQLAREQFDRLNLKNIETVNETFSDFLQQYSGPHFDLVFVDGHHDGHALLKYLDQLNEFTHDETIFVLDDIRWSASMKLAFDSIVNSDDYHVTMDFFQVGIVARRIGQTKEHFVLKGY